MFDLLGIDWGSKKIGLAYGDTESGLIIPYTQKITQADIWTQLNEIIINKPIKKIILGYPLNFQSKKTAVSLKVEEFANIIKQKFPLLEILMINERGSTNWAENFKNFSIQTSFKPNHLSDNLAAVRILEYYLKIEH